MRHRLNILFCALTAASCSTPNSQAPSTEAPRTQRIVAAKPGESHFRTVRQITFGGENAEAYFSHDGQWLTLQSTRDGRPCDQQYVVRADGGALTRVSNGGGKTTCGWFLPGDRRLFF